MTTQQRHYASMHSCVSIDVAVHISVSPRVHVPGKVTLCGVTKGATVTAGAPAVLLVLLDWQCSASHVKNIGVLPASISRLYMCP